MNNNPPQRRDKPGMSTAVQSFVRHLLSVLVLLGAVRLNDDQIEGLVPSIAVLLVLLGGPFWSWLNQRKLFWTQPPKTRPVRKPLFRRRR